MLEPDASKGARPVLRGGGGGDPTSLPDYGMAALVGPSRSKPATLRLAPAGHPVPLTKTTPMPTLMSISRNPPPLAVRLLQALPFPA